MKKILFTTLLFCGLAFTAQSQSLTYNKVILLTALDTVPQGKVWKVTSYTSGYGSTSQISCKINDVITYLFNSSSGQVGNLNATFSYTRENPFPIWLPAGTTLEPSTNCGSLSIIEFTENNE